MDKDSNGVVSLSDVKHAYSAKQHPDVKSGRRSEDEVLFEFLDTFDQHHSEHVEGRDGNVVTLNEWLEYHNLVSMAIDRDDCFEVMMANAWGFNKAA